MVFRDGPSLEGAQDAHRDALEDGFVRGLRAAGARVAGVETRATDPSQVPWYADRGLSTVDNVDDTAGRAALVFVLAGAEGDYGVRDTATRSDEARGGSRRPERHQPGPWSRSASRIDAVALAAVSGPVVEDVAEVPGRSART